MGTGGMGVRDTIIPTLVARVTLLTIGGSSYDLPRVQGEFGIVFSGGGLSEHIRLWNDPQKVVSCMSEVLSGTDNEVSRSTEEC